MLECYNWLFCNLIGDNRFSVILHKSMMLSRPDPLPFYERVWLRQTKSHVGLVTLQLTVVQPCRLLPGSGNGREDGVARLGWGGGGETMAVRRR